MCRCRVLPFTLDSKGLVHSEKNCKKCILIISSNVSQLQSSFLICDVWHILLPSDLRVITFQCAMAIMNIVIALFGTLANGLVIMAYYRNPRLRTIQNTIFLLLAITDLAVTAFVEPMYVVVILTAVLGKPRCLLSDMNTALSMLFVDLSLVAIALLSLESYITLAYPYNYQNIITKSRLVITIVVSFLIVLSATLSVFLHNYLLFYGSPIIIFFPVTIVVFTWCWTYKLVARHRKAIQTTQTPSTSQNVSQRKILRSTITAFAVILNLLACYFLVLFLLLSELFLDPETFGYNTQVVLWLIAVTLVYFNSLLNPCLVFWQNTSFRQTLENICLC